MPDYLRPLEPDQEEAALREQNATLQSRIATLEAQVEQYRVALIDAEDTILCNCVVGKDDRHHVSYQCVGEYGYACRCFAEETLVRIRAALSAPTPTTDVARLRAIEKAAKELDAAFQESVAQGYTHQWTYRMQCAVENNRRALVSKGAPDEVIGYDDFLDPNGIRR